MNHKKQFSIFRKIKVISFFLVLFGFCFSISAKEEVQLPKHVLTFLKNNKSPFKVNYTPIASIKSHQSTVYLIMKHFEDGGEYLILKDKDKGKDKGKKPKPVIILESDFIPSLIKGLSLEENKKLYLAHIKSSQSKPELMRSYLSFLEKKCSTGNCDKVQKYVLEQLKKEP